MRIENLQRRVIMEDLVKTLCIKLKELMKLPATGDLTDFMKGVTAFLIVLKNCGSKPATPSYLSEELGVTKGRITAIINSLTAKGLVTLGQIPGDRRKVNVRITKAGVEFIDKKLAGVEVFLEEFVAKISADKLQEMNSLLDVVIDAMKGMRV